MRSIGDDAAFRDKRMKSRAVLLASASALVPSLHHDAKPCERTFTGPMFDRAARATYRGTRLPHRGAYGHLWHYAKCQRPPSSERHARVLWHRQLVAWASRRRIAIASRLAFGKWAIPAAIVMCESRGRNLPPNSAGASGYYQIIPGTWTSYGGRESAAYLASKPEQDAVASRIWREGGSSQWTCASLVRW